MVWENIGSIDTNEKTGFACSNAIVRSHAMVRKFRRHLIASPWLKHKLSIH